MVNLSEMSKFRPPEMSDELVQLKHNKNLLTVPFIFNGKTSFG